MKKILFILLLSLLFISCADSKKFNIDGKEVRVEPYGWFNPEMKHDSINYKVSTINVIWSALLIETIIVPIVITGDQLYEPVSKKEYIKPK